jgi:hypothetical protein
MAINSEVIKRVTRKTDDAEPVALSLLDIDDSER